MFKLQVQDQDVAPGCGLQQRGAGGREGLPDDGIDAAGYAV